MFNVYAVKLSGEHVKCKRSFNDFNKAAQKIDEIKQNKEMKKKYKSFYIAIVNK